MRDRNVNVASDDQTGVIKIALFAQFNGVLCLFSIPWGMFLRRMGKIGWHSEYVITNIKRVTFFSQTQCR